MDEDIEQHPGAAPHRPNAVRGRGRGRGAGPGEGQVRWHHPLRGGHARHAGPHFAGEANRRQHEDWRAGTRGQGRANVCMENQTGRSGFPALQGLQNRARPRREDNINQDRNVPQNHRNNNRQQPRNRQPRHMGFKGLEELSQCDPKDILLKINERKDAFMNLIGSPIEGLDMFVLFMKLIAKVCQSSFDELKLKLLLDISNSKFLGNFQNYLMGLPYPEVKAKNNLYWNNQQEFWENFIIFCESIVNLSPSTALHTCGMLIEGSSKCCLELLQRRHGFELPEQCQLKLTQLRERLTHCEKDEKASQRPKRGSYYAEEMAGSDPPDDFRNLSVVPSRDDLRDPRPFVRPNLVKGTYRDVEHYLDVQFRLLREDCFGPLCEGIAQFIENPNKKKFDNIRVYHNVKFVENYVSKTKIGLIIKLDDKNIKNFTRINWDHSKRFIFGSLLLFTTNNCKNLVAATIIDRDPKLLTKGMIPVSIVGDAGVSQNVGDDVSYVMIESEVYFEPYFHVMKALQDPSFPEHLAMGKYIVNVNPEPQPPAYLNPDQNFAVETTLSPRTKFCVLNPQTWPTKEELGLNESQYQAYQLALTQEFAVIQGPPGTGKTFLAVKVAKTLLQNLSAPDGKCLMLVICYTNHALDQFLEAIIPMTDSIARIGGQSRNEAMTKINLAELRTINKPDFHTNRLFYEQKDNLNQAISALRNAQERVDNLNNGVLSYNCLEQLVPESRALGQFFANIAGDPLLHWLFEERFNYQAELEVEAMMEGMEEPNAGEAAQNVIDEDTHLRTGFILDNFEVEDLGVDLLADMSIKTSFTMNEAEKILKNSVKLYGKTFDPQMQQEIRDHLLDLKSRMNLFRNMEDKRYRKCGLVVNNRTNFARLSLEDRWLLYYRWANVVLDEIKRRMRPIQKTVQRASTRYEEARMMIDMQVLQGTKVVGMTTSGAARLRKLLVALAPTIVIVEEAAEVLEPHIVTSLTSHCQHLVLIGDHQQLRPSAAYMKLARHYNMEVSLFERMITNGIHSRRLGVQHRMRPELATLICPHIYPELENHPSVEHFPAVRGMTDNLFFLTHDYKEEEVDASASKSNAREADMTLKLANYLMQQGYAPEDVTILAAYSGQMFYMRKNRDRYAFLSQVKITVVDNYQGEESKIILLSLVRNNNQNKIGFLGTENRVCVALSRAREGFYIFGNMDILKRNSELWEKISQTLENSAALGTALMLRCENHPNEISTISSPEDFNKVPEGGCLLKCNFNLPCGHQCPLVCHGYDRSHNTTKCLLKCERTICELNHACPLLCWKECKPCIRPVQKTLPCGHVKTVPCHLDSTDPAIKCNTILDVTLPSCGHKAQKECHENIEAARCPVPCEFRVDKCGHVCRRNCHVKDDPDHEKYLCTKPCAKSKKDCSLADVMIGDRGDHQCPKQCHESCDDCTVEVMKKRSNCRHLERVPCNVSVDAKPCRKNCTKVLECGHHCKNKCFEPCGDCKQKVKKSVPECNHVIEIMCMETATREMCKRKCERKLSCGHDCANLCGERCDSSNCTQIVAEKMRSLCGHLVQLPCNVYQRGGVTLSALLKYCAEPCNEMLACEHYCGGSCSQCHQRRLHVACKDRCNRPNICGHLCKQPCNQACPPCKMPCEIKCAHSRCNRVCGAPCVPCKEKCSRVCPHLGACKNLCGEPCSRPPCDEPCPKSQACGHPCRGLCGEPCPNVCKICRPEDFPEDIIQLGEFEDDAKFVKLQDCKHVESVENLDHQMTTVQDTIEIRQCYRCRIPIINTHRYKDLILEMYKNGINVVKERVYGNARQIASKKRELLELISEICGKVANGHAISAIEPWQKAFFQIKVDFAKRKQVSLLQLEIQSQYLNILQMIAQNYAEYADERLTVLQDEMLELIAVLCRVLTDNIQKISQQLQMDVANELKRMGAIIQLSKTLSHQSYLSMRTATKAIEASNEARVKVLTWKRYEHTEALAAIKKLQDSVKVTITQEERDMVIRAIGSKAGSWYKCPNGHIYTIDACGGAMEISKCGDCGAPIGGRNHALLADNAHAGEVDGSAGPAWPGTARLRL